MNNLSVSLFLKKCNSIRIFYCDIFKSQGKITLHVITNCYKRFFLRRVSLGALITDNMKI